MIDLKKLSSAHFIGIGGIGVSAIARMFLVQGKKVSGSDRSPSEITDELLKLGAKITFGEQAISEIPEDTDLIIYSAAIEVAEPEFLAEIKKMKMPSLSYSEALGEISRDKYTIAIAGTHGKTTTTGMVATVLLDAGLSPTVIVGSVLNREKSNFVLGDRHAERAGLASGESDPVRPSDGHSGKYFVVEADEYRRSFLSLSPNILVINNLDLDHLDYFKDLADIQSAYIELAKKVPADGFIITDLSNPHIEPILKVVKATVLDYTSADTVSLNLPLPGKHNIQNAQVALTVGAVLGVSRDTIIKSLNNFQGTWRRFEKVGTMKSGALVYDDYAHNPQKVKALLSGLRELFPNERIIAVFQPHLFSRTKTLFQDFVTAFGDADEVIFAPIFPAREAFDSSISSDLLAEAVGKIRKGKGGVKSLGSFAEIVFHIKNNSRKGDIVVTVGAGDVYKIGKEILK